MVALQWKLWWLVCWETFAAAPSQAVVIEMTGPAPGTSGRMAPWRRRCSGQKFQDLEMRMLVFWCFLIWINCIFGGRIILRGFDGSVPTFPRRRCYQHSHSCSHKRELAAVCSAVVVVFFRITWIAGCCIILLYQVILIGWNLLLPHRFGWFMACLCYVVSHFWRCCENVTTCRIMVGNVSFSQTFWMFISPTLGSEVMGVPPNHPKFNCFKYWNPWLWGIPVSPF